MRAIFLLPSVIPMSGWERGKIASEDVLGGRRAGAGVGCTVRDQIYRKIQVRRIYTSMSREYGC